MEFKVLLVFLAMLLNAETERSKYLSTRSRLCVCSDRVIRLSSYSEVSFFVSCEDKCTTKGNAGVLPKASRRHIRLRRAQVNDVLAQAEKCQYLTDIKGMTVKINSVTFHDSGISTVWYVQVTWSPFTGSSQPWIGYYVLYGFGDESKRLSCLTLPKNQTSVNITSSEKEKIIYLNVVALPMSLNQSNSTEGLQMTRYLPYIPTAAPHNGTLSSFTLATPTDDKKTVITYVSISIGVLVGVGLGAALLVYFMCPKKPTYFPPEFKFHAFVIYQKEDSNWVSKELLPFLEEENRIKCCIHYRDFTPGMPFMDSMADSIYNSYKIIAVFSSNFMQSKYCIHELQLAQYRLLNQSDDSLIIIRLDKTDPSRLPPELRKRNFIDYSDALEKPFWKSRLLKFLNPSIVKSGNEDVFIEQDQDNNNGTLDNSVRTRRTGFDRLNSTVSNATEISIVTLNEERLI